MKWDRLLLAVVLVVIWLFCIALAGPYVWFLGGGRMIELWRRFCCWIGWHSIGEYDGFDGCSARATCRWCGYRGMIDSQGNLF